MSRCDNPRAHEPHRYGDVFTSRLCEGVEKQEHFCGDRKAHKRHENSTHYCPGITRAQIQAEGIELRKRFRQYGILLPLRLVIRERQWFLNVIAVLDQQQHLVAQAAKAFGIDAREEAKIVANKEVSRA